MHYKVHPHLGEYLHLEDVMSLPQWDLPSFRQRVAEISCNERQHTVFFCTNCKLKKIEVEFLWDYKRISGSQNDFSPPKKKKKINYLPSYKLASQTPRNTLIACKWSYAKLSTHARWHKSLIHISTHLSNSLDDWLSWAPVGPLRKETAVEFWL